MTIYQQNINIVQIYPFNNPVSSVNTKSVVLAGISYVTYSKFYNQIMIISKYTETPFNDRVYSIKAKNKKDYYNKIINLLKNLPKLPKVIEIHQDVNLAVLIAKTFKEINVSIIRHGPALYSNFSEKFALIRYFYAKTYLSKLKYVFCISNYARNNFRKNYPNFSSKFITLYNTYGHLSEQQLNKEVKREDYITFVGKLIKKKGIFIFLNAIKSFLKKVHSWQVVIIGANFSNKSKYGKVIANLTETKKSSNISNLLLYEKIPVNEVFLKMKQSKILVVPCIVAEPFCLVALEGHIAGCIIVTSGRGALKELSGEYAYYLDNLTAENLTKTLDYIINNLKEAEEKAKLGQKRALEKFNHKLLVKKLDDIRESLINYE